jgi:regulator of protease activity HflC (stomatin/prohibitin superfamily)
MSKRKLATYIVGGLALAGLIYMSLVVTPFGHRSVVWQVGGVSYEEREPGLSFIVPFVQRAYQVDVREQRYVTLNSEGKANAFVQSLDLQEITVRASLVYSITPDQAAELYDQVGPDYATRIVEPIFFDAIKEAGGQVEAEAFASQLAVIADQVQGIVTPQLEARGLQVLSVAIEDAVFDPDFILSVKEKVIANQEAEEQRRLVAAEEAKRSQIEIQAAAERERATALGLTPEQYLDWLYLQTWDGALPATVVGDSASSLIFDVP